MVGSSYSQLSMNDPGLFDNLNMKGGITWPGNQRRKTYEHSLSRIELTVAALSWTDILRSSERTINLCYGRQFM